MLKLEIVLDKEKIKAEGQYDWAAMQAALDGIFKQQGLIRSDMGIYVGSGKASDFAHFWSAIWALAEKEWFMNNVEKWVWYNSDDGRDENDFATEDIIEFCKSRSVGVYGRKAI